MSLVHDNLRREDRPGTGPVVGEPSPTADDPEAGLSESDYTRELARKQQLLVEGITRLQDTVDALGRQLDIFDRPIIEKLTATFAENDYRFKHLVRAIVQTQEFQDW